MAKRQWAFILLALFFCNACEGLDLWPKKRDDGGIADGHLPDSATANDSTGMDGKAPNDVTHSSDGIQGRLDGGSDSSDLRIPKPNNCTKEHMYIKGRHLYGICDEKIIPIGVNEMIVWNGSEKGSDTILFSEIKKTGANIVRIVWHTRDGTPDELDTAIGHCIANKMIAMPELHDATGKIDQVPDLVRWWTRPEVVEILRKHEKYLLVNISNEAGDLNVSEDRFKEIYSDAITKMRNAGIRAPLVIDGTSWGQNIDILQATFSDLQKVDPMANLMFSVHMWWASNDGSKQRIIDELQQSADIGMPTIVGEFAPMAVNCSQYIDVKALIAEATKHEIGWMPWSWGKVKNNDCEDMGMTSDGIFGHWRLTQQNGKWGEVVAVTDPNSIKNRAIEPISFSLVH